MANERKVWLIKVLKLQREHLADTFFSLSTILVATSINFVHADFCAVYNIPLAILLRIRHAQFYIGFSFTSSISSKL